MRYNRQFRQFHKKCANDLSDILNGSHISRIFVNGKAAEKYYNRYTRPATGMDAFCLPSTSPANAAWSLEKLIGAWSVIKRLLNYAAPLKSVIILDHTISFLEICSPMRLTIKT